MLTEKLDLKALMLEQPKYNFIFKRLVSGNDDIVGAVAYAFYKQQKIEFVSQFNQDHGRDPTDDELSPFHMMSGTDSAIRGYVAQAETVFNGVMNEAFQAQIQEQLNFAIDKAEESILASKIDDISSFKSMAINGIVGGIASAIFIAAITFFVWITNKDGFHWIDDKATKISQEDKQ